MVYCTCKCHLTRAELEWKKDKLVVSFDATKDSFVSP